MILLRIVYFPATVKWGWSPPCLPAFPAHAFPPVPVSVENTHVSAPVAVPNPAFSSELVKLIRSAPELSEPSVSRRRHGLILCRYILRASWRPRWGRRRNYSPVDVTLPRDGPERTRLDDQAGLDFCLPRGGACRDSGVATKGIIMVATTPADTEVPIHAPMRITMCDEPLDRCGRVVMVGRHRPA